MAKQRPLWERCAPDSIQEFRMAAAIRFDDGDRLWAAERSLAAIYMWGYSAEMTLKAAYFNLIALAVNEPITGSHRAAARTLAINTHGLAWPHEEAQHNIEFWGKLLVAHRLFVGKPYLDPGFATEILDRSKLVYRHWRVHLRYHKNSAYRHEVSRTRESARWLLDNALLL
jgi:hypothetical protein